MTLPFNTIFHQRDVRETPVSTATATAVGLTDGQYLVTDYHADMTAERKVTAGEGIDFTDAGANSTFTISGKNASTTNKGIASFNTNNFTATAGAVSFKSLDNYETAWINRSFWDNRHLGTDDTKNADSNLNHALNTSLQNLLTKVLISPTGADSDSFEILSIDEDSTNKGITIFYVDANNIKIQTGNNGMEYITDTGIANTLDTEDWYYKIKVWKLG